MKRCHVLYSCAIGGLGLLAFIGSGFARGDSLLLKDGRLISGKVTHTDSGYVIHTRTGDQKFSEEEVQHWTHSESSDPSDAPPPVAAPAPKTGAANPGAGPTTPTTAVPAKPAPKNNAQKSVAVLVNRGNTALAAGDYKAARDSFVDALLLEPKNPAAAEGVGYAYLSLKPPNYIKARDALEIAYAGMQPPPRSVACDLALSLAQTHNPMRAAKVLKEYLTAHPAPLDEPALNALAAALFQADESTRHNTFFAQVGNFYDDYNRKLEGTRPGEKRWGTQWLDAATADKKLKTYWDKSGRIDSLKRRMSVDQAAYNDASNNVDVEIHTAHSGAGARIAAYRKQMADAQTDFNNADGALKEAQKGYEIPPIETALAVVEPEGATAVASAAPISTTTDLTAVKPPDDPNLSVPGKLFNPDAAPPANPVPTPPPGAPAVIVARAPEPAPHRKLRIETNASAFPIGPDLAVTAADAVADATTISLQIPDADSVSAEVVSVDEASGLALLRMTGKKMAYLPLADSFSTGNVTCISYPEVNLFDPIPAAITGNITATGGKPIANLSRSPRLSGGPVLVGGKVVGVLLSSRDADQHTVPVATLSDLKKLLGSAGIPPAAPAGLDPKTLTMQLTAVKEHN